MIQNIVTLLWIESTLCLASVCQCIIMYTIFHRWIHSDVVLSLNKQVSYTSIHVWTNSTHTRWLKFPYLFIKKYTKSLKLISCILVCHSILFLPHFKLLDKNNSVNRSHLKWEWRSDRSFISRKYSKGRTGTHKTSFFHINMEVGEMMIMNDLEWLMFHIMGFVCEKFRKSMQRTDKGALKWITFQQLSSFVFGPEGGYVMP